MPKFPTPNTTSPWVERTLAALTLEQRLGQLLHPNLFPAQSLDQMAAILGDVEPGGVFLHPGPLDGFKNATTWLQERSTVPVVISADLENGAGNVVDGATTFPNLMSLAATNREDLAYEMGRAAALEGRACGVHWSFAPVVDINGTPHSPGPNVRGLGDDPGHIIRLSTAMIRGLQENGLCATAKHFPDGGFDDRDPHICTTINPLSLDRWLALTGRIYQAAIDLGVWSIMPGHTSLPALDPGEGWHMQQAPPAVLSQRLMQGLLRERLGFQGVIITDAMDMAGVASWGPHDQILPAAIAAGCDMVLFAEPNRDYPILLRAVEEGRLPEKRVEESVRRILALKETLGLHQSTVPTEVDPQDRQKFAQVSRQIAQGAITVPRDRKRALPLELGPGSRVLSYHFRGIPGEYQVDGMDDLLRARGVEVTRYDESAPDQLPDPETVAGFDAILIHAVVVPSWGTSLVRPAGVALRDLWRLIVSHHPRLVFISYGSPYHLYEFPNLPLFINAYSTDAETQQAVLGILTGELKATGKSPVDLDRPWRVMGLAGQVVGGRG